MSGVSRSGSAKRKAPRGACSTGPQTVPARALRGSCGSETIQIETGAGFACELSIMDEEVQLLQRYLGPQILALFA